jgi:hypothetical protein
MDDLWRGHVDSCSRMQEFPCDGVRNSQHSGKNRLGMRIAALASPQRSGQSSQLSHSSTGVSGGTLSGKDDKGLDLADPVESMPHVHAEAVCRVDAAALIETPPQSTSSSLPRQKRPCTEVVTVVPIICGTACDFMMRCKACNWYPQRQIMVVAGVCARDQLKWSYPWPGQTKGGLKKEWPVDRFVLWLCMYAAYYQ